MPYQKNFTFWFIRNWFCNFKLFVSKCPNYGSGRAVWAKSKHPDFLRPYLPNGGGGRGGVEQCPKFGSFFLMAPLSQKIQKKSWLRNVEMLRAYHKILLGSLFLVLCTKATPQHPTPPGSNNHPQATYQVSIFRTGNRKIKGWLKQPWKGWLDDKTCHYNSWGTFWRHQVVTDENSQIFARKLGLN